MSTENGFPPPTFPNYISNCGTKYNSSRARADLVGEEFATTTGGGGGARAATGSPNFFRC